MVESVCYFDSSNEYKGGRQNNSNTRQYNAVRLISTTSYISKMITQLHEHLDKH